MNKYPLVNFLICGSQKSGTSALAEYLKQHSAICMAKRKEVHFFDKEHLFNDRGVNYEFYHSFFQPGDNHLAIGEATPVYMYWTRAAKRIWQYNPDMKLIVILRNPVDRAYSHWNMEIHRGNETIPFEEAIINEAERCKEALPLQHRFFSYTDRGFYSKQLERLWSYFPRDNTLILKNEDLRSHPRKTLNEICAFLELDYFEEITPLLIHKRSYTNDMNTRERTLLKNIFESEIKNLEKMLEWDCSDWLN